MNIVNFSQLVQECLGDFEYTVVNQWGCVCRQGSITPMNS